MPTAQDNRGHTIPSTYDNKVMMSELVTLKGTAQVRSSLAHSLHFLQIVLSLVHDRHPAVVAHILRRNADNSLHCQR